MASGVWAASCDPAKWNLPNRFPLDAFVLSVLVEDPAVDAASGGVGAPFLRASVSKAVHVPDRRGSFDLSIRSSRDGCPGEPLSAPELRELYARGDELLVVAFPGEQGVLETFVDWIAYAAQLRTRPVDNVFDYFRSLFRLESLEEDTERIQPLRSLALFQTDSEAYRGLLQAQLRSKRLRRRMMNVHEFLKREP